MLALFLGLIVSAGLYFAYLWPHVEPTDEEPATGANDSQATSKPDEASPASMSDATADEPGTSAPA